MHVFENACNLIDAESDVLSLVTPLIGNGPFNVVIPPLVFSRHISPADSVVCTASNLGVGNLSVDLTSAKRWTPRPAWEPIREKRAALRKVIPLLYQALHDLAPSGSLAALATNLSPPLFESDAALQYQARAAVEQFLAWVRRGEGVVLVEQLAGLGPGLTPAGDDFLMGSLLAIWACQPDEQARSLSRAVVEAASPRTTPFSAAWLRAAARGECSHHWHALFESIVAAHELAVSDAAAAIIRQGHTSGSDMLTGFVMMLKEML